MLDLATSDPLLVATIAVEKRKSPSLDPTWTTPIAVGKKGSEEKEEGVGGGGGGGRGKKEMEN